MIDRIKFILEKRNLSPSRFADKIGVPRSTISHILSGRNKPSLEVIQKILNAFPDIPVDWLMMGKGKYDPQTFTLFDSDKAVDDPQDVDDQEEAEGSAEIVENTQVSGQELNNDQVIPAKKMENSEKRGQNEPGVVEKVIIFYNDGTFREYKPSF